MKPRRARWIPIAIITTSSVAAGAVCACGKDDEPLRPPAGETDGGDGGDGGFAGGVTPSPCAQAHFFCDDFDKGELGATWDEKNISGGPLSTTQDARAPSAPYALRARSSASPTPRSVVLYKNLPDPPGKLHCAFDVLLAERTGGAADVFELRLNGDGDGGGTLYYAYLQVTETTTLVGQETVGPSGKSNKLVPVANLPTGQWRHVTFDTDFKSFTLSYDEEPSHTETMSLAGGTKPQMALGLVYTEGGGPYDFLFDNVACDVTPP